MTDVSLFSDLKTINPIAVLCQILSSRMATLGWGHQEVVDYYMSL